MTQQPLPPPGSAVTTPEQMLAEIRAMHNELTALNATINPALNEIRGDVSDNGKRIDAVEARVSTIEQWKWKAAGAGGVLIICLGIAEAYLSSH